MGPAQSKFSSSGMPRLGIPEFWMADGLHGIRPEVLWNEWDQAGWTNDSCVAYPALTYLAATWNPEMSMLYGMSIGEEARYRNKTVLLGPDGNIYKCLEHIDKKGTEIGNINNMSVSKRKVTQYAFAHSPFDDPECIKCKMLPICGGGCPLDRTRKERGMIDSTCPYIKENINEIIKTVNHEK